MIIPLIKETIIFKLELHESVIPKLLQVIRIINIRTFLSHNAKGICKRISVVSTTKVVTHVLFINSSISFCPLLPPAVSVYVQIFLIDLVLSSISLYNTVCLSQMLKVLIIKSHRVQSMRISFQRKLLMLQIINKASHF